MDFKRAVEDLNSDIEKEFSYLSAKNEYKYSYSTNGKTSSISFLGITIFNSEEDECLSYQTSDGKYVSVPIENMSFESFEDYLELKVLHIGILFMKYSFHPNPRNYGTIDEDDYLDELIENFFQKVLPWKKQFLKQLIKDSH